MSAAGDRYEGEVQGRSKAGKGKWNLRVGVLTTRSGDKYNVTWKNNLKDGEGRWD